MRHSLSSLLLAATVTLVAACAPSSVLHPEADQAVPSSLALEEAEVVASGTFSGQNDHVVTGGVEVLDLGGRHFVRLDDAFTLDGAPDPKVGFGRSGSYIKSSTVAPLRAMKGAQVYALPEDFDIATLNEAYIWCDEFSVALGVAPLRP